MDNCTWPKKKAFWLTATVLSCLSHVSAAPVRPQENDSNYGPSALQARDTSIPLRILGVGASIMAGWGSANYNGGRKPLRDALRADGWDVDMVGSLTCGDMVDNDCEAVAGDILTQILARIPNSTPYKPNVVVINGGTNDAVKVAANDASVSTAGERMDDVLNALWNADGMSDTCIILSTLIPSNNPAGIVNIPLINAQYRNLITTRASEGKCIYLAEMWPNGDSDQWFQFDTDYLTTEDPHVHPNEKGHSMMASVYYNALQEAFSANRIVTAGEMDLGESVCDKVAGTGTDAGGLTQRGSGYDDDIFYHDSEEQTATWSTVRANADVTMGQWKFARLFNPLFDDLLEWSPTSDSTQVYKVYVNSADGLGTFSSGDSPFGELDGDLNCEYPEGVNFIDMNGDGLDDLVYIDASGNGYLSINQGDGGRSAGTLPTFKRVSDTALIMATNGVTREFITLADIDGDGRGDFGRSDSDGNVEFWRNGGWDDIPAYWQALGRRFTSQFYGDGDEHYLGTRFEDVNGDGRDDMVWMDESGAGHVFTNSRSCAAGLEGDGLNVAWREGYYTGTTDAAYKGMSPAAGDDTNLRERISFARIYGEENIFGNMPRQDYVFMDHFYLGDVINTHYYQMRIWKNTGGGATKLKGDGNKYCNMMGHANGMVDYVWAYSYGTMEMWVNRGKGTISDSDVDGYWEYYGVLWTPPENINRKDLHLADWDGDGLCDIIWVTPDTNKPKIWLNRYAIDGNFNTWNSVDYQSSSTFTCNEERGLGFTDYAVRFADIDGDGKADYLCIAPDSSISGYIHDDSGGVIAQSQIKISIDKDRANLRFADVNGDGREDMLWVEKFSGDAYVYYNNGQMDASDAAGSTFGWTAQTAVAYAGQVQGSCEYFADLNGDGFPDEHYLSDGTFNNVARTSLSPGCGLTDATGDDSDMTSDLPLPAVPNSGSGSDTGSGSGLPSTGTGCTSGTGSGDYSDLCQYVCARGFCPDPCSCTATGTYDAGTEDTSIDGYANTGYDATTYTPLCNFACSHRYCPDECLFTNTISSGVTGSIPTLPTLDDYVENVDATAGAFYRYQVPDNSDLTVSMLYASDKVTFPSDITCADTTPGDNGVFVGCVGDTVEWLFMSMGQDTDAVGIAARDSSKHTFTPLPHLASKDNCSMHCQLEARSNSAKTWTPVGEGTLHGRAHSLHFKHTGKSVVFKAVPGSIETANLEGRAETRALGAAVAIEIGWWAYVVQHLYGSNQNDFTNNLLQLTTPLMDAAVDNVPKNCLFVATNTTVTVDTDEASADIDKIAAAIAVEVAPATSLALDTDEVDSFTLTCTEELSNKRKFVVWPSDPLDVAALRILLLSLDPTTDEHISVNSPYGTMYFISKLSLLEVLIVSASKQCREPQPHCENNVCEDPSYTSTSTQDDVDAETTAPTYDRRRSEEQVNGTTDDTEFKLQERDGTYSRQTPSRAELAFASNPYGSIRAQYNFDTTPANRVKGYILEGSYIDTSIKTEFQTADSTGATMQSKTTIDQGNTVPSTDADGWSHGTGVFNCMAGANHGIGREAVMYAGQMSPKVGRQEILDFLDRIQKDWLASILSGTYHNIGVINLSWGYSPGTLFGGHSFDYYLAEKLKVLNGLGLLVVVASGNNNGPVSKVPALFGNPSDSNYVPNILVVGGVDKATGNNRWTATYPASTQFPNGYTEGSQYASWVTFYGPADNIETTYLNTAENKLKFKYTPGTSYAAGYVSGLATALLGLPGRGATISTVAQLRTTLTTTLGYERTTGSGLWALYNGAP